jgi:hypothetical protein
VNPGFNEGSFQVNFLIELATRYGAARIGAIQEPPLQEERNLGFDAMCKVSLGGVAVPLFLQFKSHEVVARGDDRDCWRYYGGPHYRFPLRQDRLAARDPRLPLYRQQNLLVLLRRSGEFAYYVAPCFHGKQELDDLASESGLFEASVYIDPADIGSIYDRDRHHVSYAMRGSRWAYHSEFQPKGRPRRWSEIIGETPAIPISPESLHDLAERLRQLVEEDYYEQQDSVVEDESAGGDAGPPPDSVPRSTASLVGWLGDALGRYFGAFLVLIPVRPWGMPAESGYLPRP